MERLRKSERAVAPAVSTIIITAAVVVMILVAMTFANTFLDSRMAENEFTTNKQFMYTTALQIDDIAWTIGRTQTVRYSSQYGNINFESSVLAYTFEISEDGLNWETLEDVEGLTGIILFNLPISEYSMGNNYFERIMPHSDGSFLQEGPSAPVTHVFCIEKLPMKEGNYTRIVAVPSVRMLNSTIEGSEETPTNYFKFYLPALMSGNHLHRSQSVTITGQDIIKVAREGIAKVRINVTYSSGSGFDADFFKFDNPYSEVVDLPAGSVVEFYVGKVIVTLGKV